ncbi:MAG: hypothetical protein ACOC0C_02510 [Bacteroidota bacterium]
MKYILEIDERTKEGRLLMTHIKNLSTRTRSVKVKKHTIPEVDDPEMAKLIMKGHQSGKASRSDVMKTISGILEK